MKRPCHSVPLSLYHFLPLSSSSGMALIIVVAIMAILSALAASFAFQMRMEEKAAFNYLKASQARVIALGGVNLAIGFLEEDRADTTDTMDTNQDIWAQSPFDGSWVEMKNKNGELVGVYSARIIDLNGKININTAGNPSGTSPAWTPYWVSFKDFLDAGGWNLHGSTANTLAQNLLAYRYGTDGVAGTSADDDADSIILDTDGIDNNANGSIDESEEGVNEPDEFVFWKPYLDTSAGLNADTPFIDREEIQKVAGIKGTSYNIYDSIAPFITPYSLDLDINDSGVNRVNLNLAESSVIDTVLLEEGIGSDTMALQLAANIADYRDRNSYATVLYDKNGNKYYGVEGIQINEVMPRTWVKFRTSGAAQSAGVMSIVSNDGWSINGDYISTGGIGTNGFKIQLRYGEAKLKKGKYLLAVYCGGATGRIDIGWDGDNDNNLTWDDNGGNGYLPDANGWIKINVDVTADPGESDLDIGFRDHDGGVSEQDACRVYYFILSQQSQYMELVNLSPRDIDLSGWMVQVYNNSGTISRGYLPAGTVIPGRGKDLSQDPSFLVLVDRKDTTSPEKRTGDNTSYEALFGNDSGTWGDAAGETYPVVELTPDPALSGLSGWTNAPALFFHADDWDHASRGPATEWNEAGEGDTIIIYDDNLNPVCVSYITPGEYSMGDSILAFTALEKEDPTQPNSNSKWGSRLTTVSNENTTLPEDGSFAHDEKRGVPTAILASPGSFNSSANQGSTSFTDFLVKDNPFASVGELWRVKGETERGASEWQRIYQINTGGGSDDYLLARLPDRFTISEKRLEAEQSLYRDRDISPSSPGLQPFSDNPANSSSEWVYDHTDPYGNEIDASHPDTPFLTPYYYTSSTDQATWAWGAQERISPDTAVYNLYILGLKDAPLEISVNTWNEGFRETNWVYLIPGADGIAYYGEVVVGDSDTEHALSDTYIQVSVRKPGSFANATYFDGIVLAPLPRIYGRINVNTADTEVLHALPGFNNNNLVNYIVSSRPYRSVGYVWNALRNYYSSSLTASRSFSRLSNLITVRGKLFRIEVTARYIRDTNGNGKYDEGQDEVLGEYTISTIYER